MKKGIVLVSALGIGASLLYLLTRDLRERGQITERVGDLRDREANSSQATMTAPASQSGDFSTIPDPPWENLIIDDQGTDQIEAANILRNIRDTAFESSNEKLALALGRPVEEIDEWTTGSGVIDGDVVLKARTLAMQRGIEIQ